MGTTITRQDAFEPFEQLSVVICTCHGLLGAFGLFFQYGDQFIETLDERRNAFIF